MEYYQNEGHHERYHTIIPAPNDINKFHRQNVLITEAPFHLWRTSQTQSSGRGAIKRKYQDFSWYLRLKTKMHLMLCLKCIFVFSLRRSIATS